MRSLYDYPRAALLLVALILVAGLATVIGMPRLEDPHLRNRVVSVLTPFPGAGAARVEALVTDPVERRLREVAEVETISSTSRDGLSFITVEMADSVSDVDRVAALLRDKLSEVTDLPEGAGQPVFDDDRLYALTAVIGLVWKAESAPSYAILGRHARELETRLSNIDGTDFVRRFGLPAEEISVTIQENLLAPIGLTPAQVAQRVADSDAKTSSGVLSGTEGRYVLEVAGEIDALSRLRAIPLLQNADTGFTTVGDVAEVRRSTRSPPDRLTYINGDYGVAVGARMLPDRRVDLWMDRVNAALSDYRAALPGNIEARVIFDQAAYTEERLSGLVGNLAYSVVIVLATLLIILGWRASLIAGSILPLATLAALTLLNATGYQIEQLVVAGMIVALGIMVDNAIVVTDSIQNRILDGAAPRQAVTSTVRRLWLPLLGSTATTVIAFMPILLVPGAAGEFIGGISASVIATLVASYLISFILISAIAGRMLGGQRLQAAPDGATPARRWWREGLDGAPVRRAFRRSLSWSLAHPRRSMLLSGGLPVAGLLLAMALPEEFFPPSDRDQFHIEVELPADASIDRTRRLVEAMHRRVTAEPAVVSAHWYIGESAAKFYYNLVSQRDGVANYAQAMVTVTDITALDAVIARLQRELDAAYPETRTLVRKLQIGPPYAAPVEIRISGPDLERLRGLGETVRRILSGTPDVLHTRASLIVGRPKLEVAADEEGAATLDMRLRDLSDQLRGVIDGVEGGSMLESTENVPVRVRTDEATRSRIAGLRGVGLVSARQADDTARGNPVVPLSALARVELAPSLGAITRRDGERVNIIQGFTALDTLPATVFAALRARLDDAALTLPPGYRMEFGGESEERNKSVRQLMGKAGILGVLMVISIILTFNSFRMASITVVSALQAAGLGLLSLWAFGHALGFVVIVGLMGLVGLAINAAIVILSELRSEAGIAAGNATATIDGVMRTGRHILATTLTTFGGFMPLILSDSPFWPPFAVAIAGGAVLTMVVSFYFVPAAWWLALGRDRMTRAAEA